MKQCPRCKSATKPAVAINKGPSEFWVECTRCNTFVNTYVPQPHQVAFHEDPTRFSGNFGGYGSGKTLVSREELIKHILLTPGGNGLIGANVTSQYEQTIKRDLEADIPIAFVKKISVQKSYIEFKNGYRLMFRPFDNADKLRSYNIDFFVILEASEVKFDAYIQLKSRIRNRAATLESKDKDGNEIVIADWRKGIIESNPDSGWIRNEILLKSGKIVFHGDANDKYEQDPDKIDHALSTHVTDSEQNKFLPPGFINDLKASRPDWWVKRYILGSFLYSEGLVYPSAPGCVCNNFEIPRHWLRIAAFDYGLRDDSVFVFGAVDPRAHILYIYQEIRTNDKSVEQLARLFLGATKDIPVGAWITSPLIDPKSGPKRDYDKKTLSDHFVDYGIYFKAGHVNIEARVYRLNTYLESGKIRIMQKCKYLIEEFSKYKFIPLSLDETKKAADKPEDKNNHGINGVEWIAMELPANPKDIMKGIYDKSGRDLTQALRSDNTHYAWNALAEPEESVFNSENEGYSGFSGVEYLF